jgi:hypothetical protein
VSARGASACCALLVLVLVLDFFAATRPRTTTSTTREDCEIELCKINRPRRCYILPWFAISAARCASFLIMPPKIILWIG